MDKSVRAQGQPEAGELSAAKRPYVTPELKRLGTVAKLTAGGSGSTPDFPGSQAN